MVQLNYQEVISMLVLFLSIAIPIAIIIGVVEVVVNMFLGFVFGKEKVKL